MRYGAVIYLLLCGGDKATQKADVARACKMASQVKQAEKVDAKADAEAEGRKEKAKPKARPKARKG